MNKGYTIPYLVSVISNELDQLTRDHETENYSVRLNYTFNIYNGSIVDVKRETLATVQRVNLKNRNGK